MFDVSSLAFREQFEAAVVVSSVCLAAAVVLREWFTDREIRIIARVLGVAGWAVVVTFAWRMTETSETLATQLMVRRKTDATSIADPVRVVAVASEYTQTIGETKLHIVKYSDGKFGSLSFGGGCRSRIGSGSCQADNGNSGRDGIVGRSNGSALSVPTGSPGIRF